MEWSEVIVAVVILLVVTLGAHLGIKFLGVTEEQVKNNSCANCPSAGTCKEQYSNKHCNHP